MYKIVCFNEFFLFKAVEQVEDEVKKLKSQGWVEQGGVSISSLFDNFNRYYIVAQAMVKKEK